MEHLLSDEQQANREKKFFFLEFQRNIKSYEVKATNKKNETEFERDWNKKKVYQMQVKVSFLSGKCMAKATIVNTNLLFVFKSRWVTLTNCQVLREPFNWCEVMWIRFWSDALPFYRFMFKFTCFFLKKI